MIRKVLLVVILSALCLFSGDAKANVIEEQMNISGARELDEAAKEAKKFDKNFSYSEKVESSAMGKEEDTDVMSIIKRAGELFFSSLKESIADTGRIMLAILIFGVALKFIPEGSPSEAAFYATYAVVFTIALFLFRQAANVAKELIEQLSFFTKAAVPVMCTLSVPSGQFASSAATAGVIAGICVVTEGVAKVLMPLTCLMAALAAANNLSSEISLKGLEKSIQKVVMWGIGIITTIFISMLKIRGITGASMDGMAGKTVKFAVGNMVPVVGGIISGSLDSIISYSKAIKSGCGAVGILAIIYIIIPPLLKIGAMLTAFRLTGIITAPVAEKRILGAVDNFADVLGMVLMLTVVVSILFIIAMGSLTV